MVCRPGVGCLYPGAEEIFYPTENDGSMVDGVNMCSEELQ